MEVAAERADTEQRGSAKMIELCGGGRAMRYTREEAEDPPISVYILARAGLDKGGMARVVRVSGFAPRYIVLTHVDIDADSCDVARRALLRTRSSLRIP